jgi:hypothetical protein
MEWRKEWFEEKFMAWSPENLLADCHPTNKDFWTPKQIDIEDPAVDFKALHELIFDHPYWKVKVITNESFRA